MNAIIIGVWSAESVLATPSTAGVRSMARTRKQTPAFIRWFSRSSLRNNLEDTQ